LTDYRAGSAAVMFGDRVFVLGGQSAPANQSMELFLFNGEDLGVASMIALALVELHQDFAAVSLGSHIYAVSGRRPAGYDSVEVFPIDIDGNVGTKFTINPTQIDMPRADHTTIAIGNNLYVFGGNNNSAPGPTVHAKIADDGTFEPLVQIPS